MLSFRMSLSRTGARGAPNSLEKSWGSDSWQMRGFQWGVIFVVARALNGQNIYMFHYMIRFHIAQPVILQDFFHQQHWKETQLKTGLSQTWQLVEDNLWQQKIRRWYRIMFLTRCIGIEMLEIPSLSLSFYQMGIGLGFLSCFFLPKSTPRFFEPKVP